MILKKMSASKANFFERTKALFTSDLSKAIHDENVINRTASTAVEGVA